MSSSRRVLAPEPVEGVRPAGPASYFASIEATYGQPVQHWIDLAVDELESGTAHMAVVAVLKEQHGLGHGHANAVVAFAKAGLAD